MSSNFKVYAHKNVIQKDRYRQLFINYLQNSHQGHHAYAS